MAKKIAVQTREKISVENIFLMVTLATASSMVIGVSLAGLLFVSKNAQLFTPTTITSLRTGQTGMQNTPNVTAVREAAATIKEGVTAAGIEAGLNNVDNLGAVLTDIENNTKLKEGILAALAEIEAYLNAEYEKFQEHCFTEPATGEAETNLCFYWDDNLTAMSVWYPDAIALVDDLSTVVAATNTAEELGAIDITAYAERSNALAQQYQALQADRLYDIANGLHTVYTSKVMDIMYHVKTDDADTKKGVYQNLESIETKIHGAIGALESTEAQLTADIDSTCSTAVSTQPKINVGTVSFCESLQTQRLALKAEKNFYETTILPALLSAKGITYDAQPTNFYGKATIVDENMTAAKNTLSYLMIQEGGEYPQVTFDVYWNGGEMTVDGQIVTMDGMAKVITQLADSALAASESLLYLYDGTIEIESASTPEKDVVPYLESVADNLLQTSGSWSWDLDRLTLVAVAGSLRVLINDQVLPVLQQIIDLLSIEPATEPAQEQDTFGSTPTTILPSPRLPSY